MAPIRWKKIFIIVGSVCSVVLGALAIQLRQDSLQLTRAQEIKVMYAEGRFSDVITRGNEFLAEFPDSPENQSVMNWMRESKLSLQGALRAQEERQQAEAAHKEQEIKDEKLRQLVNSSLPLPPYSNASSDPGPPIRPGDVLYAYTRKAGNETSVQIAALVINSENRLFSPIRVDLSGVRELYSCTTGQTVTVEFKPSLLEADETFSSWRATLTKTNEPFSQLYSSSKKCDLRNASEFSDRQLYSKFYSECSDLTNCPLIAVSDLDKNGSREYWRKGLTCSTIRSPGLLDRLNCDSEGVEIVEIDPNGEMIRYLVRDLDLDYLNKVVPKPSHLHTHD